MARKLRLRRAGVWWQGLTTDTHHSAHLLVHAPPVLESQLLFCGSGKGSRLNAQG